jgi:hypothetical protein
MDEGEWWKSFIWKPRAKMQPGIEGSRIDCVCKYTSKLDAHPRWSAAEWFAFKSVSPGRVDVSAVGVPEFKRQVMGDCDSRTEHSLAQPVPLPPDVTGAKQQRNWCTCLAMTSRDSSLIEMMMGCFLDDWRIGVWFPVAVRDFSLLHRVQFGSVSPLQTSI